MNIGIKKFKLLIFRQANPTGNITAMNERKPKMTIARRIVNCLYFDELRIMAGKIE